jgi:hypothetical protein
MNLRIIAVGQDTYWLDAVQHAVYGLMQDPPGRRRRKDFVNGISDLPRARPDTVLLLDASDQCDLAGAVTELRSAGWKYVVVVAADPSVRQATSVLRQGLGFDYWIKTYVEEQIRKQIAHCFKEIAEEKPNDES